eukprot:scaffold16712_cov65-Phaeocystis_antarctica.AAC.9
MRCHNGTDADGKSVPGPCRTPAEIDALVWDGTITLMLEQKDLTPQASFPTKSLIRLKKQFRDYVHATYDLRFMVRFVTIQPRAFFDQFDPNANQHFLTLDRTDTSYTDYRPVKVGMWNKPDPAYVPQYAAFYLLLGDEYVDQQRAWYSVFRLVESWGASTVMVTRYTPLHVPFHPLAGGLLLHGLLYDRLALERVALHAPGQGPRPERPHEGPVRLTRPARRHLIPSAKGTGPDEGIV